MNDPQATPIPPTTPHPRTVAAATNAGRPTEPVSPPSVPATGGSTSSTHQAVTSNAADVAQEAKSQASEVAHVAGQQVQTAWHSLRQDLRSQASQQTDRAGESLRQLSTQLQALRRGDVDAAGPLGGYAEQLQDKVQQIAERFEQGGFDGMVRDARDIARRRPVAFLAGAAAAGFLAGRLVRSSASNGSSDSSGQQAQPTTRPVPPVRGPATMASPSTVNPTPPVTQAALADAAPPVGMSS